MKLSRRKILVAGAALTTAAFTNRKLLLAELSASPKVAFYVIGDTHYLAEKEQPGKMSEASAQICGRLVDTLNNLPGSEIPADAGGGRVATPRGVIHAGDVIDTGDKSGSAQEAMQRTEFAAFTADYGLDGKDGRLKFPTYEIHGNHDAPQGKGLALEKMIERTRDRPGVINKSRNGAQYSWDWEDIHFINLGLIVGTDPMITRKRRYAALDSLEFLVADLKEKVGTSGRPIVITHHVDVARYTGDCLTGAPAGTGEWDPCDVHAFHAALADYNVAAIFYGHTHTRKIFQWDGASPQAKNGIHVFNTDNASHFSGDAQAFFYVEFYDKQLIVREVQTKDRWQTGFFTPQSWKAPISG